ncbi:Uma2 family endonuclease [Mesorhizobium sp. BAC0120]|uniref:Uma2 family endonuclease n=1 Tax=Mesorhizobium sp. BAC0120 TaxID=3090670 RepID=UPI00298D33C1|nr:Uma2 family endonuclease [Mesorhizobium sp. BAC0120]MDW6022851.1 Uma2 family endonuclease [Mesorhizobium sp. BAC0120]
MTMVEPKKTPATYADLEAVPPHLVAEIIDGELVTHPRPSPRHGAAASALGGKIGDPYQFGGGGGPGGWIFIVEPELHLGSHVIVPDLAGWRRERLRDYHDAAFIEIPPDWICEVLSASTEQRDRTTKRRIYAEAAVTYLWLLDPRQQLLEVFVLATDGNWKLNGAWRSDDMVSAVPFDAISFSLADLWPLDRPLGLNEDPQHLYAGDR